MSEKSRARFESLLKWVNTFDGVCCESFQDLSSGQTLLECLRKIMPGVLVTETPTEEPWKELFSIFEEFCGCSLEKAVSAKEVSSGNQEHIARVVVLLLSVAVQSKTNDKIIADITSMDYEVQRDLMFFIETTLAKVKSHAIVAGTFTSGVGESLPTLDSSSSQSQQTTPDDIDGTSQVPAADEDDAFTFATPRRPSRGIPANFYNGLDSAAGAKLLMSPAIIGYKQGYRHLCYDKSSPVKEVEQEGTYSEREEISRMQHSVRVLQGTLQVEKKLAQEYYTELCAKIQECENWKKGHYQLERKLDGLQEISDIQDELSQATSNLALAEKAIASYKSKVESLEVYKKRSIELESKMSDLESRATLGDEQHAGMSKLENVLLEKSSSVKRLELQLSKTTIELETKSTHMESLLLENREANIEMGEMRNKYRQLESHMMELKAEIANKDDAEVEAMEKKRKMTLEIQKLQDTLLVTKEDILDLQTKVIVTDTSMAATESQMKELNDELSSKISQLTSKAFEVESLKSTLSVQDERIFQLRSKLKTLEQATADNEAMLQQDIADEKSALASKECQIKSLEISKKELEGETSRLHSIIDALKKEDKSAVSLLECQRDKLRAEFASKTSELTSKNQELESLRSIKEGLDDQVTQLQSSMHTLEQTIAHKESRLQKELSDKISAFSSKESHSRSLEITNTELETEMAKLKSTIDELRQENESALADFECQINELHTEVSSKASALASKTFELETLRSSVEGLDDQTSRLQSDMKTLEESAAIKEASLQQELAEKFAVLAASKGQIVLLENANRELKNETVQLQDNIDSLNQDIISKDAEKVSRETKLLSLETSKTDLENKFSQLQFDTFTLEEKVQDGLSSRDHLEDANIALKIQATELKLRIKSLEQDIATKDTHLAEKDRQLESLDTIKEELESEFKQLQLRYQRLEHSATIKEAELEARMKEQEVEAMQQESTIDALRYGITTMEAEVSSKQGNITALELAEKEQQEKLLQLEASSKLLQQDLASKSDQLADSNARVSSLQDQLSEHVKALEAELMTVRANVKAEVSDKDQMLATLKQECTSKSDQLADSNAKVSSLVEMRDSLSEHVGVLETELMTVRAKIESVEAEVSDKDQMLATLKQECTSKSDQLADSNTKVSSLVEMRDRLSEHVKALKAELSTVRATIEGFEAEVSDKDQMLTTSKQECTSKSNQLADNNVEISSLVKVQDQLSKHVGALEVELTAVRAKIKSVKTEVSDKDQMLATLKQECTSKSDQLADSNVKISSLVEHVGVLETVRAKIESVEAEVSDKDQMLATLKEECAGLHTKASHLTQLVASQQSSLKAAEDLASTLTSQKKDVQARCEQLEEKLKKLKSAQDLASLLTTQTTDIQARYKQLEEQLKDAVQTNNEREIAVATCKNKLESYEISSQRRFSIQSEREETLSKDNKWLQSNLDNLMKELHVMAETAQNSSSRCEQLEADLTREKSVSLKLKDELGSLTAESTERHGPMSAFEESSISTRIPSDRYGSSRLSQTTDMQSEFSGVPFDDKDRVRELKRRNKRALPHLKSSYPIEMQVKPETTPTSDDRLKHGVKVSKGTQCASTVCSGSDRGTGAHVHSPMASSSQRSSSPMTPNNYRRKLRTVQRPSMCPSLNLREYLDESVSGSGSEKSIPSSSSKVSIPNSTAFDIAISPPKGKAPKRLQDNKLRRRVESNESDGIRRETIARINSNKSVKGSKRALRSRNDN